MSELRDRLTKFGIAVRIHLSGEVCKTDLQVENMNQFSGTANLELVR